MAEQVLKDVGIWIEGWDFSGVSNSLAIDLSRDTPESTTFKSGGWREYEPGLKGVSFSLDGFFGERDAQQFASLGQERSVMVAPAGEDPGDVAHILPVRVSGHTNSGSVGELLAMTYAASGDGAPDRAQIMDVREGIDANVDQARQNFGAIPVDDARKIILHVTVREGQVRVDLMSRDGPAPPQGTPDTTTLFQRAMSANITATGVYELVVQSGALHPITDEYWFLRYIVGVGSNDVDVAAATLQGHHSVIIPVTPVTPPPPTPGTVSLRGGLSADATPAAAELTIDGANHLLSFPTFTNQYVLVARLASEADITSIILSSDVTRLNQIGGFTKHGSTVTVMGDAYNVWVSNNALTFSSADMIEAQ